MNGFCVLDWLFRWSMDDDMKIILKFRTPNFDKILSNADGKQDNRCLKEVRIQNSVIRINKEYSYSYSEFCLLNSVFSFLIKLIK
jgi:hypothetical protein